MTESSDGNEIGPDSSFESEGTDITEEERSVIACWNYSLYICTTLN